MKKQAELDRTAGQKVDTTEAPPAEASVPPLSPSPTAAESEPTAVALDDEPPFDDTEMVEDIEDEPEPSS